MEQLELRKILSSKFNFDQWQSILSLMFSKIEYFTSEVTVEAALIKSGGQIGNIRLDDGRSLAIFIFEVADNIIISRNRRGLRDIAAHYVDQSLIHGALVFYYSHNQRDYRLTYIAKQTSFSPDGELIKSETAPKRYTFLLGENEKCTTAASRLYELITKKKKGTVYLTDVTEAFSVERLNKEFFAGYKSQYKKFLDYRKNDSKDNRDYVKKLLGRLVFLQFLQKKGWMGVPSGNYNWSGGDKSYLSNLVERYDGNERLLSDVLKLLFFETLNEPRTGDIASPILGKNIKIPYLNGGLFDKDRLDLLDIDFPYIYFKDLMEFFGLYNFTIDENDPDDAEVGIDPEMLGHIFENLLEDNKDKGAFYTPKEIVQYMSRESIIQYLKSHTNENLHPSIELLVKSGKVNKDLQEKATAVEINSLLQQVKVCDPAIGSGAFPMGVLNVLFHCRQLLYGFMHDKQSFSPSIIKREIIQENIYGVDIEQGAVDIARLRFWLSLVVDENDPQPLPNLDYKIMCGNSIVARYGLDVHIDNVFEEYNKQHKNDKITLQDFKELVKRYTNTSSYQDKKAFRTKIEEIKSAFKTELDKIKISNRRKLEFKIIELESPTLFGNATKDNIETAKKLRKDLAKILKKEQEVTDNKWYSNSFEWRFEFPSLLNDDGKFVGFDVVIGNPPYIKEYTNKSAFDGYRETSPYYKGKMDLWYGFACYGLDLTKKETGLLTFIATNNWTSNAGASKMRDKICTDAQIIKMIDFGDYKIFDNAGIQTMIMMFSHSKSNNEYEFDYRHLNQQSATLNDVVGLLNKNKRVDAEYLHLQFNREGLLGKGFYFNANEKASILQIIRENCWFLTEKEIANGIHPHYDFVNKKLSLKYNLQIGEGIFGLSTHEKDLLDLNETEMSLIKPYYTTEQIHRYYSEPNNKQWLIYTGSQFKDPASMNSYPKLKAHLDRFSSVITSDNKPYGLHRAREERFFLGEKIVVQRKCADKPSFSFVDFDSYVSATFYVIKTDRVNQKYLVGLLNSKLIEFWLKNKGKMQGTNYQLDKEPLLEIPIKVASDNIQNTISVIVDYILFAKKNTSETISSVVSNDFIIDYFEKIIDGCVYELYFPEHMKEKEIDIIDDVIKRIRPIRNLATNEEKTDVIWNVFSEIKKTDNPIRNRLELFAARSPEILKLIIEG